jgi:hypothetical protein
MVKDKEMKITVLSMSDTTQDDFRAPSKYYIVNSLGDYVFIHARERAVAEQWITENYGKGFFKLRTSSLEKAKGSLTCTGTATRAKPSSRQP